MVHDFNPMFEGRRAFGASRFVYWVQSLMVIAVLALAGRALATPQLSGLTFTPSCYTAGSPISITFYALPDANHGTYGDIQFSTTAASAWSNWDVFDSAGVHNPPITNTGHVGGIIAPSTGSPVWLTVTVTTTVPPAFTGTLYVIVNGRDDSFQIYNWGSDTPSVQLIVPVSACPPGTLTNTPTPTNSPTITVTSTITITPTISSTYSASPTYSDTPTASPSFSSSPTYSASPTMSNTPTPSCTNTPSPLASATDTATITRTFTATRTPTGTFTVTPTSSQTPTCTVTPSPSTTSTPLMVLGKSSNKASVTFGDTITFCINYLNDSANTVNLTVWDTVPASLTFAGADSGGSYSPPLVVWTLSNVASNGSGQVCFWGKVTAYPLLPGLQQRHFAGARSDPWRPAFALWLKPEEGYPSLE